MAFKYRIHYAPSTYALEQAARVGSNMAVIYSVGPCSHLWFAKDPMTGREMDEFPIYFDAYPKVAAVRRNADAGWIEPLRRHIHAMCDRSVELGMKPVIHLYEPMLPLLFEREYPDLVTAFKRPTQEGTIDVHTKLDPDNPATWDLMKSKYRELAGAFPKVAMYIITTGDTASTYWCVPRGQECRLHQRLAHNVQAARDGIREAGADAQVCCRLWWRNFPDEYYRDGHRMTEEITGLKNATDYMCRIGKPHNDPSVVLPALFKELPADVPVMYKSTRMDIHDNSPITHVLGKYPKEREQIIEISFELYHMKDWPWCKIKHIRQGYEAARDYNLAGYVSLPINVENNRRDTDPESGNLGRMNTWLVEQLVERRHAVGCGTGGGLAGEGIRRAAAARGRRRASRGRPSGQRRNPVGPGHQQPHAVCVAAHDQAVLDVRRIHPAGLPVQDAPADARVPGWADPDEAGCLHQCRYAPQEAGSGTGRHASGTL